MQRKIKSNYFHAILVFTLASIFFNPFSTAKYGLSFLTIYIIVKVSKEKILNSILNNIQFWILLFFCVSYAIIQFIYQFVSINVFINYLLYPLIIYIFGIVIVSRIKNEKQIMHYLYAVILGFSLFGILAVLYSIQIYGTAVGLEVRTGIIPWTEDVKLSATGIGIYICLGIALSGLLFVKTNVYLKVLNTSIFLLSFYSSIILANRTGLIIAVLSVIIIYFTRLKLNSIKNNIKIVFLFMIQCILIIILFNNNVFNVKMMWLQSNAYKRFNDMGVGNDPRFMAWQEAFYGLFTNPLGGKQAYLSLGYAHNLWLDVGWTTGFLTFLLLVLFTFMTLKDYKKILINDNLSLYIKYLITTMICGFLLTFMVEPVIEANILFFCAFCFISGVLRSINNWGISQV